MVCTSCNTRAVVIHIFRPSQCLVVFLPHSDMRVWPRLHKSGPVAVAAASSKTEKAATALTKSHRDEIVVAMDTHPEIVPALRRECVRLGAMDVAAGFGAPGRVMSLALLVSSGVNLDGSGGYARWATLDCNPDMSAAVTPDDSVSVVSSATSAADDDSGPTMGLEEEIPETYRTLGGGPPHGLSVKFLKVLLRVCEPSALSRHALRGLAYPGKREVSAEQCMEVLEFCTDMSPDMALVGCLRDTVVLIQEVTNLNKAHGRLCRDIVLPPNWPVVGWYTKVDVTTKSFKLRSKAHDAEIAVLPSNLAMSDGPNFEKVTIMRNFPNFELN